MDDTLQQRFYDGLDAFGEAKTAREFRTAIKWQLKALIDFALKDGSALEAQMLWPLVILEMAMCDLDDGGRPPLLAPSPRLATVNGEGNPGRSPEAWGREAMLTLATGLVDLIRERDGDPRGTGKAEKKANNGAFAAAVNEASKETGIPAGALKSHYKKQHGKYKRGEFADLYDKTMGSRVKENMTAGTLAGIWEPEFKRALAAYYKFVTPVRKPRHGSRESS